jgi:hypothetical protein
MLKLTNEQLDWLVERIPDAPRRVAQVVLDLGSRFRPQVESGDANDVAR